jgi:A/G-specific adenine glycosylase
MGIGVTLGIAGGIFLCKNSEMTKAEKMSNFTRVLFEWHKNNYRPMPWRKTHDPYKILVSEIMLQQTQVDRVRKKYVEFLKKFPTVSVLAAASLGDVLRVWSGLGYNRRAKYLHECAKQVVALYDGKFPKTFTELTLLPGIGRSTAGALLAFSFGQDTPMIDTNIRRILVRVFFKKIIPSDKELYVFAQLLIPKGKGRMWNYAMLDLGATQCTARGHSHVCPLLSLHGVVGDFAYKKPQKQFKDSRRYYRGQILKLLVREHSLSVALLPKLLGKSKLEITDLLNDLKREGMIVERKNALSLAH